ncbi:MAG: MFS transporter [Acidimicrobiia bacterium]
MVRHSLVTRWFALVFLASLAAELTNSLLVHFPGFLLGMGASELRIGTIVGVSGAASILVRPWIGRVIDRNGRRRMIRLGCLMLAASTLSYAFIDNIGAPVIGARVLQGLGQAMAMTAFWAYIADRLPDAHRAQGIALFGISGLAPLGIGPALGDQILGSSFGYQGVFLVATAFALLSFLLAMRLEETEGVDETETTGFFALLGRQDLRPVWFVILVLALGFTAAFVFVTTYVTAIGAGRVGTFFIAYAITAIIWRLTLSWVPDRVGPVRMVAPGLCLYALGLAIIGLVVPPWGLITGGVLTGLGHGISFPVVVAIATSRAAPGERGTAIAIFTTLFDVSLFGASPVIGWIIEQFGYATTFMTVAISVLVGMILFYLAERKWVEPAGMVTGEPATAPVPHV